MIIQTLVFEFVPGSILTQMQWACSWNDKLF